jgi:DNA-binding MarR family transcriptional regulator
MARLDNVRVGVWRGMQALVGEIERNIDEELRGEWDISLGWFDVLASLQRLGGRARPLDVAADLRLPASSVSRRLDRLQEEGWVARHRHVDDDDHRAVEIELTKTGRRLWREMSVTYRRALQALFAVHLDADDISDMQRVLDLLVIAGQEIDDTPSPDDTFDVGN